MWVTAEARKDIVHWELRVKYRSQQSVSPMCCCRSVTTRLCLAVASFGGSNVLLIVCVDVWMRGCDYCAVPVCPHAGGVGLCEHVQHLSMFDYVCCSATLENRIVVLSRSSCIGLLAVGVVWSFELQTMLMLECFFGRVSIVLNLLLKFHFCVRLNCAKE